MTLDVSAVWIGNLRCGMPKREAHELAVQLAVEDGLEHVYVFHNGSGLQQRSTCAILKYVWPLQCQVALSRFQAFSFYATLANTAKAFPRER